MSFFEMPAAHQFEPGLRHFFFLHYFPRQYGKIWLPMNS
jgi:hypothetical protein